jgi:regulator of replication initiation timing
VFNKEIKEQLEAALAENEELKAEIEALKKVDEVEALASQEPSAREPIAEKDRTFTVTGKDKDGKDKEITAVIGDVNKLYIDGKKYTLDAFLKDKEAQATAVAADILLITIKK